MLILVLDTNIYLAAMGSRSFCYDLLLLIADRPLEYQIFVSDVIMTEIKKGADKLLTEKIINHQDREKIMHLIEKVTNINFPEERLRVITEDPDDDAILECAVAAQAHLIVTMDHHVLRLKNFRTIAIVQPKTFFYMLSKE